VTTLACGCVAWPDGDTYGLTRCATHKPKRWFLMHGDQISRKDTPVTTPFGPSADDPEPDSELLPCGCRVCPDWNDWETECLCDWHLDNPWGEESLEDARAQVARQDRPNGPVLS
jgi:hypothetical protein